MMKPQLIARTKTMATAIARAQHASQTARESPRGRIGQSDSVGGMLSEIRFMRLMRF
jgi:hypothetical protein